MASPSHFVRLGPEAEHFIARNRESHSLTVHANQATKPNGDVNLNGTKHGAKFPGVMGEHWGRL